MSHIQAIEDPYENPVKLGTGDEYAIRIKDGKVSYGSKIDKERPSIWKGSQKIQALSDEAITVLRVMPSGKAIYRIEETTVSWNPAHKRKAQYFCSTAGHGNRCPHTRRIDKYRTENFA